MKKPSLTPEQAADVRAAVDCLRRGGVILYPTDTIWGLGCDARNSRAVRRIFEIKKRDDAKALITLVDGLAMLERTVKEVPDVAYQLIEAVVSPTTIIYDSPSPGAVARELVNAQDGSIGVRISSETISAAICRGLQGAIVSTSANVSGQPAPRVFSEISPEIIAMVDYVCTSRRDETVSPLVKPSGIIRLSNNGLVKVIR